MAWGTEFKSYDLGCSINHDVFLEKGIEGSVFRLDVRNMIHMNNVLSRFCKRSLSGEEDE